MKKVAIILGSLFVFALVACSGTKEETPVTDSTAVKTDTTIVVDTTAVADTAKAEVIKK